MSMAAGKTETMQENIQDWLEPDEGDSGFQLDRGRNCCSDILFYLFPSALPLFLKFPVTCFLIFFFVF
jgi:hypothetical protein